MELNFRIYFPFQQVESCKHPDANLQVVSRGDCGIRQPQTFDLGLGIGFGLGFKVGADAVASGALLGKF